MEYIVKASSGFDSKEFYTTAKSAEELQAQIEKYLAYEISNGMLTYTIRPLK